MPTMQSMPSMYGYSQPEQRGFALDRQSELEREMFKKQVMVSKLKDRQSQYRQELSRLFLSSNLTAGERNESPVDVHVTSIPTMMPLRGTSIRASSALSQNGSQILNNSMTQVP